MTIRLSDLTKRERTVAVHFDGVDATLSVTYCPDRYTPASQAAYNEMFAQSQQGKALACYVAARVVAWDLADDSGQVIPLTEQALADVDIVVLDRVVMAIVANMRPSADDPK